MGRGARCRLCGGCGGTLAISDVSTGLQLVICELEHCHVTNGYVVFLRFFLMFCSHMFQNHIL